MNVQEFSKGKEKEEKRPKSLDRKSVTKYQANGFLKTHGRHIFINV
jgi:hypothetical protein